MIDLHTHSTFSDGSLTPEQLVQEAAFIGLSAIALTDHDTIGGVPRFLDACRAAQIRGVPGVELSADIPNGSMHILGYFIDLQHPELTVRLQEIQSGRVARNAEILKHINDMGLALTMEEVASYAGGDNIGRLHFAQALTARGYVATRQEAFDRYLGKGRKGYAERIRMSPRDCIELIRRAGGVPVLAHPFTLDLGKQALTKQVAELVDYGLQGIEVFYPQQNDRQMKQYQAMAKTFSLVMTGGTDFHGAPMPDIKLGTGFGDTKIPETVLEQLDAIRSA
ncbi:MAG: PHP domain-containing protein [Kiritimatiellia bacterium]|jgi:predicted metal-dependent phosphoesterase TrpH